MAEMVLTPPLRADGREPNFLQKFGHAFVHGDIFTKLSLFVWGLGYIGHGQLIKALLVTLVQGLGLYFLGTSGIPALKKFGTLGTVQLEMQFKVYFRIREIKRQMIRMKQTMIIISM